MLKNILTNEEEENRQLFSLFQMPLGTILDNKFSFMDVCHIAPRFIDELSWWEYEEYVKRLNDRIERENKQNQQQQQQQQSQQKLPDYTKNMPNINSMMSNLNKFK